MYYTPVREVPKSIMTFSRDLVGSARYLICLCSECQLCGSMIGKKGRGGAGRGAKGCEKTDVVKSKYLKKKKAATVQ